MLNSKPKKSGYICVPYQHDKFSINVKDTWNSSRNIKGIYFVTATFSDECKPYFPFSANHYLLAKFDDEQKLLKDVEKFTNSKPSFIFTVDNELFKRDMDSERSFISTYYLEYNDPDALSDIANTIVKKDKIRQAGFAHMNMFCDDKPKFTFPYTEKLVVLELSDDRSPQSINKYCEKIRQDISRKGVVMNNFVSLSLLEKLK
jgi:hypothetical protein